MFENQFEGVRQPILFITDTAGKFVCSKQIEADSEMGGLSEFAIYGSAIYAGISYESVRPLDDLSTTLVGQRNLGVWKTCLPCDTGVGIEEATHSELAIYPNPTRNLLNINLSSNQKVTAIGMLDMLGRAVLQQPIATQVDISHLPPGNYVLMVQTEKGVLRKRVVIE